MRRVGIGIITIGFMMAAGCRHVSEARSWRSFRQQAAAIRIRPPPDSMGAWLAKHEVCQASN